MRRDDSRERAERNDFAPVVVLGPGHYWPYLRKPGYGLARQIPTMREGATRLGLVTLEQMVATLVRSVEAPPRRDANCGSARDCSRRTVASPS
jgi:hypothetical protein